jgi:hypothetical protein
MCPVDPDPTVSASRRSRRVAACQSIHMPWLAGTGYGGAMPTTSPVVLAAHAMSAASGSGQVRQASEPGRGLYLGAIRNG